MLRISKDRFKATKAPDATALKSDISPAELARWCDCAAESRRQLDIVPKGWYTTVQLTAMFKLGMTQTHRLIADMSAAGKLEMRTFRIMCGTKPYPAPHYKLK